MFQNLLQPTFDSGQQILNDVQLEALIEKVCNAALDEPYAGFRLEADDIVTRDKMRKLLLNKLSSNWRQVSTSAKEKWWKLVLHNGSVISICMIR
jgi:hypothetical protein